MRNNGKYKFIFVGKSGRYYSIDDLCKQFKLSKTALITRLRKYGIIPKSSTVESKMLIKIDKKLVDILRTAKTKNGFDMKMNMCIDCTHAIGGCSWSKDFIPVEGWEAKPCGDSYEITSCPEFESEYQVAIDIDKMDKEALDQLLISILRSACREYKAAVGSNNRRRIRRAEEFFREDKWLGFKEICDYFNLPEVNIDYFLELLEDYDTKVIMNFLF